MYIPAACSGRVLRRFDEPTRSAWHNKALLFQRLAPAGLACVPPTVFSVEQLEQAMAMAADVAEAAAATAGRLDGGDDVASSCSAGGSSVGESTPHPAGPGPSSTAAALGLSQQQQQGAIWFYKKSKDSRGRGVFPFTRVDQLPMEERQAMAAAAQQGGAAGHGVFQKEVRGGRMAARCRCAGDVGVHALAC